MTSKPISFFIFCSLFFFFVQSPMYAQTGDALKKCAKAGDLACLYKYGKQLLKSSNPIDKKTGAKYMLKAGDAHSLEAMQFVLNRELKGSEYFSGKNTRQETYIPYFEGKEKRLAVFYQCLFKIKTGQFTVENLKNYKSQLETFDKPYTYYLAQFDETLKPHIDKANMNCVTFACYREWHLKLAILHSMGMFKKSKLSYANGTFGKSKTDINLGLNNSEWNEYKNLFLGQESKKMTTYIDVTDLSDAELKEAMTKAIAKLKNPYFFAQRFKAEIDMSIFNSSNFTIILADKKLKYDPVPPSDDPKTLANFHQFAKEKNYTALLSPDQHAKEKDILLFTKENLATLAKQGGYVYYTIGGGRSYSVRKNGGWEDTMVGFAKYNSDALIVLMQKIPPFELIGTLSDTYVTQIDDIFTGRVESQWSSEGVLAEGNIPVAKLAKCLEYSEEANITRRSYLDKFRKTEKIKTLFYLKTDKQFQSQDPTAMGNFFRSLKADGAVYEEESATNGSASFSFGEEKNWRDTGELKNRQVEILCNGSFFKYTTIRQHRDGTFSTSYHSSLLNVGDKYFKSYSEVKAYIVEVLEKTEEENCSN